MKENHVILGWNNVYFGRLTPACLSIYFFFLPVLLFIFYFLLISLLLLLGRDSSVGAVTDYGLDGPGSNPVWDEIFRPVQTGPASHPASYTMGRGGRGVGLIPTPF